MPRERPDASGLYRRRHCQRGLRDVARRRAITLRNRRHGNEHQQTIAEIESLEGIFAAPDARPLGPSDLAAANRRHDEMTRIAIGEIGIDVGYRKFLFILGVRVGSEMRDPVGTLKTRL